MKKTCSPLAPGLKALTLRFDPLLLQPLQQFFCAQLAPVLHGQGQDWLTGGRVIRQRITGTAYAAFSYDTYPLLWLSADQAVSFAAYATLFAELGLADALRPYLEDGQRPVLYGGFLVVGNRAAEPLWHEDYLPGAQAYTLITPLFELAPEHGHLLYEDAQAQEQRYVYRLGEAILLGAGLLHSTEPYGPSDSLRVLLSMTLGSADWAAWPPIRPALRSQSYYYHLPCGHRAGRCLCYARYQLQQLVGGRK
ncbi:MAG: hypothetical protein ACO1RX_07250 [Candidatus Sericytochromatia bacterium]